MPLARLALVPYLLLCAVLGHLEVHRKNVTVSVWEDAFPVLHNVASTNDNTVMTFEVLQVSIS